MRVASERLQANFTKAAAAYDTRAQFQHVQTRRVLDAALMVFPQTASILDIGCGTGYFAVAAADKRPDWRVVGIDVSAGMCEVAVTRCPVMRGDAAQLPLAEASVDAAVSSLCYQWVEDAPRAFTELARVLRPGGRAVIASLGEMTLAELRASAKAADLPLHVLPMRGFEVDKALLRASGLEITYAECRTVREFYPSVGALLESMRGIGAGNNFSGGDRRFMAPKRWMRMLAEYEAAREEAGIPATWEHHFFVLRKPV
jgi:malonyl-CoA O-methyltransferase